MKNISRPLQNRVSPVGDIFATQARGTLMGNRGGRLHLTDKTLGSRRWASRAWICCLLSFKERHRTVMSKTGYTELFFLDEATALAAGHRPCFECRRQNALRYSEAFSRADNITPCLKAHDIDKRLHAARLCPDGTKRTYHADAQTLPIGVMVRSNDQIVLIADNTRHWLWSPDGYRPIEPTAKLVEVLTPKPTVNAIRHGYMPNLHFSAR